MHEQGDPSDTRRFLIRVDAHFVFHAKPARGQVDLDTMKRAFFNRTSHLVRVPIAATGGIWSFMCEMAPKMRLFVVPCDDANRLESKRHRQKLRIECVPGKMHRFESLKGFGKIKIF